MQPDPVQEWQRLTEHYRGMNDGELQALAGDFADLTPAAQQALCAEFQSRGFGDPRSAGTATLRPAAIAEASLPPLSAHNAPDSTGSILSRMGAAFDVHMPGPVLDEPDPHGEDDAPHEYTWKTLLCLCDSREAAWQIQEVLRRAGIESWIDFQGSTTSFVPSTEFRLGVGDLQILVPADQLPQAREITSRPIPQEIVEESQTSVPDFKLPFCPKCGAADPILESVDPSNTWRCEQCGAVWSDPVNADGSPAPNAGQTSL